jgi:DnaD/phage-associated family protein
MPERRFDTGFWNSPFVQPQSINAKLLCLYSWTNQHCNQAGLYEITMLTITRETGLNEAAALSAFEEIRSEVVWYPDEDLIWVKFFVNNQSRSPKFLIAAAKCLEKISNKKIVEDFIRYNREVYAISIPYTYPTDTLSIPSAQAADQRSALSSASASLSGSEKRGSGGEKLTEPEPEDPVLAAITRLYEQNIGIITPMIAEELKDIREYYPEGWFQAALKEALAHEARTLAYIKTILNRWEHEGFQSKKKDSQGQGKKGPKRTLSEGIDSDE